METGTDLADETLVGELTAGATVARSGADLRRGDTVDRYVVLDRIGAGGMGAVYSAFDPDLDRKIAIKLLHTERAAGDQLLLEAKAMAQLDHPNAVAVHDVGEHDGNVFVAMEFIDGLTLRRWLAARPRAWRAILGAFRQAGRGLAAAHAKGLVHRDFKPDNVMVDHDGADGDAGPARVRVLDFGLARTPTEAIAISGSVPVMTQTDARSGTPAYMAPEQFLGVGVGTQSDQFAYCVALYEALVGARPFAGSNLGELSANVAAGNFARPSASVTAPGWVLRVVERGLSVEPERRWPSMQALLRELERDPTRRRWLIVGAATAVAAVVVGSAAVRFDHARRLAACDRDSVLPTDVWSDGIADEIGDTFGRSGVGYAPDAWARARTRLVAFAHAWTQTQAEVCRRGVEGEDASTAVVAAQDCLDEAAGRMAAVGDRLRHGSETAIEEAISWSAGLPNPRLCVDDRELARRVAAPRDPATAGASLEIRRELFGIEALIEDDRPIEAMAQAEVVLGRAEALGWAPTVAQARIVWASAASTAGGAELRARAALETAFDEASVAGDDAVALRAALSLAYLLARELKLPDQALIWTRVARNLVARLGLPPEAPESTGLVAATAMAQFEAGAAVEAERGFAQVVEVWRDALGSEHPKLASALNNLAVAVLTRGRHAEAVALLEEAHTITERAFGPTHPEVAQTLSLLATGYARWGRAETAEPHIRRALAIRTAAAGLDHPTTVDVQANMGAILMTNGKLDEALQLLERVVAAHRLRSSPSRHELAGALQNLGNLYARLNRHDDAKRALTEAIEVFRAGVGATHPDTSRAQYSLARIHERHGDLDQALAVYREAVATLEGLGSNEALHGETLIALGRAALRAGDHAAAATACERAREVYAALPERARGGDAARCVAVARWQLGADRASVIAMVEEARRGFATNDDHETVAELDRWLADTDASSPPPWDLEP